MKRIIHYMDQRYLEREADMAESIHTMQLRELKRQLEEALDAPEPERRIGLAGALGYVSGMLIDAEEQEVEHDSGE